METIAFATLLFVVYFCSACYFFYNPKASATAATSTSVPVVAAAKPTVTPQGQPVAPEPTTIEIAAAPQEPDRDEELEAALWEPAATGEEAPIASVETEPAQVTVEKLAKESQEELLKDIDLDTLQLRPARKICGRLGIQQKVNGKDAPLSWLRAQIKNRLSEKPQETVPVIEEILRAS